MEVPAASLPFQQAEHHVQGGQARVCISHHTAEEVEVGIEAMPSIGCDNRVRVGFQNAPAQQLKVSLSLLSVAAQKEGLG